MLFLFCGILAYVSFDKILTRKNMSSELVLEDQNVKRLFHAVYTASLLEDEIRKIRKDDYAWRLKYQELTENK